MICSYVCATHARLLCTTAISVFWTIYKSSMKASRKKRCDGANCRIIDVESLKVKSNADS